jgi:hypothetical protein
MEKVKINHYLIAHNCLSMISLINSVDYRFYMIDTEGYKIDYSITNIGKFCGCPTNDKKKYITHIKYVCSKPTYNLLVPPLINLNFLQLGREISLKEINFNLYPNLTTLILDIHHITNKILCNMPNNIETLIFKNYCVDPYFIFIKFFAFDNLPMNLKKIIFEYGDIDKTSYEEQQRIVINKIKKFKLPFGCKIYFCLENTDEFIEKSQFNE